MKTCDAEFLKAAKAFIKKAHADGKPFFVWFNASHMHFRTHIEDRIRGQAGRWQSEYHDCMVEHDKQIGEMLALVDELGIADNTMVMYSTDNGPHMNSWPDAGMTPFRSEKNSNWEGAYRVPCLVRWPGVIKAGTVCNDIVSHLDWLPTIVDAAGDPDIKEKLKKGLKANGKTFKVHLDGFSLMPYFTGKAKKPERKGFFYFTDDGDLACLRYDNWKVVFMEQRAKGTMQIWMEPLVTLRIPKIFNLRTDPYERADITSNTYFDWLLDHVYLLVPAQVGVAEFLQTFKEFPPRQKAASFSVDQVVEKMTEAAAGGHT
jgi:arylsulfatase